MAEINMNLQKAIDDHLKRLYERYKSNTKVFTAAVVGHISLSTVFVISILVPFLFLQIDARETNSELERLSQGIAQQEQRAAAYRQAMTGSQESLRSGGEHAQTFGGLHPGPRKRSSRGSGGSHAGWPQADAGILQFDYRQRPLDGMPHPTVHGCAGCSVPGGPGQ